MNRLILLFLFYFSSADTEVAYLPIIEQGLFYPYSNSISTFDLSTGQIIKTTPVTSIETDISDVFLDSSEENLYITYYSFDGLTIAKMDTRTLSVTQEWQDASVNSFPDTVFLSQDNKTLYFIRFNSGFGTNSLMQLNLETNEFSTAITVPDHSIQNVIYSENLMYMTLKLVNNSSQQDMLLTYKTNDLSLVHETIIDDTIAATLNTYLIAIIDNEGENFYYRDILQPAFVSRKLVDASLNWSFTHPNENYYSSPFEYNNEITVLGLNNNYLIDKVTGQGVAIPIPVNQQGINLGGSNHKISNQQILNINAPEIFCLTGFCTLGSDLELRISNILTNEIELVYQSDDIQGSTPRGRYIGENLFKGVPAPTPVSVMENIWWLIIFVITVWLSSIRVFRSRLNTQGLLRASLFTGTDKANSRYHQHDNQKRYTGVKNS